MQICLYVFIYTFIYNAYLSITFTLFLLSTFFDKDYSYSRTQDYSYSIFIYIYISIYLYLYIYIYIYVYVDIFKGSTSMFGIICILEYVSHMYC